MIELEVTNEILQIDITNNDNPIVGITNQPIQIEISNDTIIYSGEPTKLEATISHTDFTSGSKVIGTIPANKRVHKVSDIVDIAFDSGTMVIGDANAHGRLMGASGNSLLRANTYHAEPDYKYTQETELKAWFETGTPSTGSATIIIYYS
jgi:hypothetical protein